MTNKWNPDNPKTTISISKDYYLKIRMYAQPTKVTKKGQCTESTETVLNRMIDFFMEKNPPSPEAVSRSTYPPKPKLDLPDLGIQTVDDIVRDPK